MAFKDALPAPTACCAGCMWLPRLMFKARAALADGLPPEFKLVFGHPLGVDGQFLAFFGLSLDAVQTAAAGPPEQDAAWFLARPGVAAARVAAWNELAPNLGRPGYPLTKQLAWALATFCPQLDPTRVHSVFEMLAQDEGRTEGALTRSLEVPTLGSLQA